MSNPYSQVTISGWNADPPSDDGAEVGSNEIEWQKHVDKLSQPIKTALETTQSNIASAFDKQFLNTYADHSANHTVTAADKGRLLRCSNTITVTLLDLATAGSNFALVVQNVGSGTVTVDGNASELINGATTITLGPGEAAFINSNSSAWAAVIFPASQDGDFTFSGDNTFSGANTLTGSITGGTVNPTTLQEGGNAAVVAGDAAGGGLTGTYPSPSVANGHITAGRLASSAVSQSKLKTTTGESSHSSGSGTNDQNVTLPGGQYGFWPEIRVVAPAAVTGNFIARPGRTDVTATDTGFATVARFAVTHSGGTGIVTGYTRHRYVQASPPYEPYRAGDPVPLFIFGLIDKTTGVVRSTYVAEDPPWANNGPTIINPLGRLQQLARSRIPADATPEQEIEAWADVHDWMNDPGNAKAIEAEMARTFTQEEKNRDMALIPHPFPDFDPAKHVVTVLTPTDCRLCRGLLARHKYGGDSITEMLHGGYLQIDNTPLEGLATPKDVLAVQARLNATR